ncbi:unnamed protein product [Arctia plantaginis]|uniref:Protein rolling stone-like n=1 Tax=Arctia plantaginis TaxID=874455 RepID=A0A8S1A3Z4_ARCPL|nr:unnamed protein product [Arctia plantaginis]
MVKFYRKTVSFSALWVSTNDRLSDFYASSWQREESVVPMLVVRLLLTISSLGILTWSLVEDANPYWLIYLTNWGILLVSATTMSGVVVSFAFLVKKPLETTNLAWYVSFYWVAFNIALAISIMITILYWILLHDPAIPEKYGLRGYWLNISKHGLMSCIIVTELLFSRTPVRLAHLYQPLGVGLLYALFSVIYFAAGGTDNEGHEFIYAVLNWREPRNAGIIVICSVSALVVLYVMLWMVAFLRDKLSTALMRTKTNDLPLTTCDITVL